MNARSSDRILVWALALSVVIHLIFATVARTIPAAQAEPDKPTRVVILHVATPAPTLRPRPRRIIPSLTSHASTHARISVHPPRVVAHGGGPVSAGPPAVAPAATSLPGNVAASRRAQ